MLLMLLHLPVFLLSLCSWQGSALWRSRRQVGFLRATQHFSLLLLAELFQLLVCLLVIATLWRANVVLQAFVQHCTARRGGPSLAIRVGVGQAFQLMWDLLLLPCLPFLLLTVYRLPAVLGATLRKSAEQAALAHRTKQKTEEDEEELEGEEEHDREHEHGPQSRGKYVSLELAERKSFFQTRFRHAVFQQSWELFKDLWAVLCLVLSFAAPWRGMQALFFLCQDQAAFQARVGTLCLEFMEAFRGDLDYFALRLQRDTARMLKLRTLTTDRPHAQVKSQPKLKFSSVSVQELATRAYNSSLLRWRRRILRKLTKLMDYSDDVPLHLLKQAWQQESPASADPLTSHVWLGQHPQAVQTKKQQQARQEQSPQGCYTYALVRYYFRTEQAFLYAQLLLSQSQDPCLVRSVLASTPNTTPTNAHERPILISATQLRVLYAAKLRALSANAQAELDRTNALLHQELAKKAHDAGGISLLSAEYSFRRSARVSRVIMQNALLLAVLDLLAIPIFLLVVISPRSRAMRLKMSRTKSWVVREVIALQQLKELGLDLLCLAQMLVTLAFIFHAWDLLVGILEAYTHRSWSLVRQRTHEAFKNSLRNVLWLLALPFSPQHWAMFCATLFYILTIPYLTLRELFPKHLFLSPAPVGDEPPPEAEEGAAAQESRCGGAPRYVWSPWTGFLHWMSKQCEYWSREENCLLGILLSPFVALFALLYGLFASLLVIVLIIDRVCWPLVVLSLSLAMWAYAAVYTPITGKQLQTNPGTLEQIQRVDQSRLAFFASLGLVALLSLAKMGFSPDMNRITLPSLVVEWSSANVVGVLSIVLDAFQLSAMPFLVLQNSDAALPPQTQAVGGWLPIENFFSKVVIYSLAPLLMADLAMVAVLVWLVLFSVRPSFAPEGVIARTFGYVKWAQRVREQLDSVEQAWLSMLNVFSSIFYTAVTINLLKPTDCVYTLRSDGKIYDGAVRSQPTEPCWSDRNLVRSAFSLIALCLYLLTTNVVRKSPPPATLDIKYASQWQFSYKIFKLAVAIAVSLEAELRALQALLALGALFGLYTATYPCIFSAQWSCIPFARVLHVASLLSFLYTGIICLAEYSLRVSRYTSSRFLRNLLLFGWLLLGGFSLLLAVILHRLSLKTAKAQPAEAKAALLSLAKTLAENGALVEQWQERRKGWEESVQGTWRALSLAALARELCLAVWPPDVLDSEFELDRWLLATGHQDSSSVVVHVLSQEQLTESVAALTRAVQRGLALPNLLRHGLPPAPSPPLSEPPAEPVAPVQWLLAPMTQPELAAPTDGFDRELWLWAQRLLAHTLDASLPDESPALTWRSFAFSHLLQSSGKAWPKARRLCRELGGKERQDRQFWLSLAFPWLDGVWREFRHAPLWRAVSARHADVWQLSFFQKDAERSAFFQQHDRQMKEHRRLQKKAEEPLNLSLEPMAAEQAAADVQDQHDNKNLEQRKERDEAEQGLDADDEGRDKEAEQGVDAEELEELSPWEVYLSGQHGSWWQACWRAVAAHRQDPARTATAESKLAGEANEAGQAKAAVAGTGTVQEWRLLLCGEGPAGSGAGAEGEGRAVTEAMVEVAERVGYVATQPALPTMLLILPSQQVARRWQGNNRERKDKGEGETALSTTLPAFSKWHAFYLNSSLERVRCALCKKKYCNASYRAGGAGFKQGSALTVYSGRSGVAQEHSGDDAKQGPTAALPHQESSPDGTNTSRHTKSPVSPGGSSQSKQSGARRRKLRRVSLLDRLLRQQGEETQRAERRELASKAARLSQVVEAGLVCLSCMHHVQLLNLAFLQRTLELEHHKMARYMAGLQCGSGQGGQGTSGFLPTVLDSTCCANCGRPASQHASVQLQRKPSLNRITSPLALDSLRSRGNSQPSPGTGGTPQDEQLEVVVLPSPSQPSTPRQLFSPSLLQPPAGSPAPTQATVVAHGHSFDARHLAASLQLKLWPSRLSASAAAVSRASLTNEHLVEGSLVWSQANWLLPLSRQDSVTGGGTVREEEVKCRVVGVHSPMSAVLREFRLLALLEAGHVAALRPTDTSSTLLSSSEFLYLECKRRTKLPAAGGAGQEELQVVYKQGKVGLPRLVQVCSMYMESKKEIEARQRNKSSASFFKAAGQRAAAQACVRCRHPKERHQALASDAAATASPFLSPVSAPSDQAAALPRPSQGPQALADGPDALAWGLLGLQEQLRSEQMRFKWTGAATLSYMLQTS